MFCTSKERETCDVEKMTCEGCYYNKDGDYMNEEEKEELKELINLMYNNHISQYGKRKLESYINMILDLYNQEKEKNKKLEEDKRVLEILEKEHKKEIDVREQKEIMQSKVIKLMASDMERLGSTDELIEYYFKKARGEEDE